MIKFLDGPAAGTELIVRDAPIYLRAVIDKNGAVDALDQPNDTPKLSEKIYAYRMVDGTYKSGFYCGKDGCKLFRSGDYKLCSIQPSQEILRYRESWYEWVKQREQILQRRKNEKYDDLSE